MQNYVKVWCYMMKGTMQNRVTLVPVMSGRIGSLQELKRSRGGEAVFVLDR